MLVANGPRFGNCVMTFKHHYDSFYCCLEMWDLGAIEELGEIVPRQAIDVHISLINARQRIVRHTGRIMEEAMRREWARHRPLRTTEKGDNASAIFHQDLMQHSCNELVMLELRTDSLLYWTLVAVCHAGVTSAIAAGALPELKENLRKCFHASVKPWR